MGFVTPRLPPFDIHFWYWGRRSERLKAMCQHWGEYGLGLPWVMYLVYLGKALGFVAVGLAFVLTTPGIGSLGEFGSWWTEPVVFQKVVIWGLLFEVLGLGAGFGALTLRFWPPMGGVLHWLRPGTLRLPPWPNRVPLTKGATRTWLDVVLYAALVASAVWALLGAPTRVDLGLAGPVALLESARLVPLVVLLPLIGLRDKTIFLAARAENYWLTVLVFFLPFLDLIVTLKILILLFWWASAVGMMIGTFSYTVASLVSNAPIVPKSVRRKLFRSFPEDLRPSRTATTLAWLTIAIHLVVPVVLVVFTDPLITAVAVAVLVGYHALNIVTMPLAMPTEWNLCGIFAVLFSFYAHRANDLTTAAHPWIPVLIALPVVVIIIWGNLRPDQISILLSMRYYSGNSATSVWAFTPSAIKKIDEHVVKASQFPKEQLKRLYGEQVAEVVMHKLLTFRALQYDGRAHFGLMPRAGGPDHEDMITMEGEVVAGTLVGWDFGDGHLHNEQLIDALRERCGFVPGELRVVVLESQALGSDRRDYRLVDGAFGQFERGYVLVSDLVGRQPWEINDLPAYPLRRMIAVPGDDRSVPGADRPVPGDDRPVLGAGRPVLGPPAPRAADPEPAPDEIADQVDKTVFPAPPKRP